MEKEEKKVILIGIFFILLLINLVSALNGDTGVSNRGVKFDNKILDNFNLTDSEKDLFLKGDLKSISQKEIDWVHVTIKIYDTSNIVISKGDSVGVQTAKDNQRSSILNNISDSVLAALSRDEFQLEGKFPIGNGFYGNITKEGFNKLLKDTRVKKIYAEKEIPANLVSSAPLINADDAWSSGYTGEGQTICVIDTGIDYTRSDLGGCFGSGCRVKGGYDYENGDSNPMDDNGHGTNVAGTIMSDDVIYRGIAYHADAVALKAADDDGNFDENDIISSLQWCYLNRSIYDISVVSMSFGGLPSIFGDCGDDYANEEIDDLYDVGITLVASSGNNEDPSKISYPACNDQVISVGAVYDSNIGSKTTCTYELFGVCMTTCTDETTYADKLTCFTNRGSLLDLLAPGCEVAASGKVGCGTSQAAPMVSAAVALLLEKKPDLSPGEIKAILQYTGVSVGSWKRIDVGAALDSFCVCDDWNIGACGTGGCGPYGRLWTRSCSPSACDTESDCVYDESCVGGGEGETSECTASGYEFCWESEYGDCSVSIAVNMYENVNNIKWGAVNDSWDPYVINNYTFGWNGVDTEHMYYGDGVEDTCTYGGCDDSLEVGEPSTLITSYAPSIADRETILGYDDTVSNACWLWNPISTSFRPNYGASNPIYVLNCFNDGDCSSSKYCNKTGSWSNWNCVNKKSNGQSCTLDSQCSSGYCDNDGVGLGDDGWCFTPYNTYFDGQETSYCEYSTDYVITDCDERQAGTDLNKCVGVNYYEEECSNTCQYQDINSTFECGESGCSCSQPLCDGLASGSDIITCSSQETYFADNCTSSAEGQDRGDNICRNSSFASGCTADDECSGIVAGTGNCSSTCELILPPNDIHKFYVKNSTGNSVAWLGNLGNIILKGKCFSGGSCDSPGENSFIVGNLTDSHTAFINSTGDLCIEKGDCSDESAMCNQIRTAFVIKNSSNANVSYIDFDGDLCLTGKLYENSIYI